MAEPNKAKFVEAGHSKEALLAAEVTPPFAASSRVLWAWVRRPFERQSSLIAVDARRLPAPAIREGANG